jgi:hypothetical protein
MRSRLAETIRGSLARLASETFAAIDWLDVVPPFDGKYLHGTQLAY